MARHTFFCIDAHTCGNPVRLVAAGGPLLPHLPMAERRAIFLRDHDWVRRALMFEPRGHDVMSGAIPYPPSRDDCDVALLYIEVSGCLPMCGHGTIGAVTALVEAGLVRPRDGRLRVEAPAGVIEAELVQVGDRVESVRLRNVASYLDARDLDIDVPGIGVIRLDIAYGGNFYAIIEPQPGWPGLDAQSPSDLIGMSRAVRDAVNARHQAVHATDARIAGVSHVMWCDDPRHPDADARNAVFYGDKALDRSPCGTGSSARMAQLVARGRLSIGDRFVHESIIGTRFDCRVESATRVGSLDAIVPSVSGWAKVIGHNTIFVDDDDPLAHGFQIA